MLLLLGRVKLLRLCGMWRVPLHAAQKTVAKQMKGIVGCCLGKPTSD